ncbi:hypothetical protein MFLAVUS_007758 [Mucor flavus]|uniref:Glycosyltransferase family 15 protein n=1 Tax=Mucor flavus TaxID=439312 RepID=A0ABP9Z589_9FUNG
MQIVENFNVHGAEPLPSSDGWCENILQSRFAHQVLDDTVQSNILSIVPNATFGHIPPEQWSYPAWIDQEKLVRSYKSVNNSTDLESDQRMARYSSGFFFDHPLLQEYDWYWRIEPGSKLLCDITYDPFLYMERTHKQYGFVLASSQTRHSTLPAYIRGYTASRRIQPKDRTLFPYFTNTACQFVSNFEIGSLNIWRNATFRDFFRYLDDTGNFFYEFWSDGSVHSLAAGLFLDKDQIHYFEDIGYQCSTHHHCPSPSTLNCRCTCPVTDRAKNTCISYWKALSPMG